ncbi:enolase C-terminal domain-like protein [Xanthobacter tagetidis]|jgi:L-alanine-DL-glutamate epimerase-like enolase superfamily enzyme|uniref:Mandelate racemase n=1 Tax=Xanthobacter tagetidis TaxID=60216 RepID=A0A3L6ZVB9_9HYPH|nr:enolase C-terminal domain-like protein [Xanthobacter tagetidis]MBB6310288.1 L-alanine-DL-glutamate epimerase-like enolase superfamily enzyme [Xanthobacter tagetidis]RLP71827.1 mandelate racemase [Xanthobacter tagetidis]
MKIDDVSLTLFAWDDIPPTAYAAHTGRFKGASKIGLLTISTDAGVKGHAFLGSAYNSAELDGPMLMKFLKPAVMGQDPLDRERLNAALWRRVRNTTIRTIGAMDVALWDIAGKVANLPIHRLLGSYRDRVKAYASSQILDSAEEYAEEALHYKSINWAAYKLHPPQEWREDIRCCSAVRKAVGDDYTLALDSAWAYTYDEAVRVGLAIQDMGYAWYEDPLTDADIYNYTKLRQKLNIPVMATEFPAAALDSYAPWIMAQATDFLRGDVALKGGLTTVMKTAHLAEAFHMNYEVHHGGNSLNNVANLHAVMAIKNTTLFEVLLPDGAQKYGLATDIEPDADGYVYAPTEPGLGADIDFELIERKKVGVLT